MSTITNDLKKEKRTDGEMEVSYHTKPPCLGAVHLGRQRVFNQWFDNLCSFLHPAKHGFLFILKKVLFKEINDTEIPIKFSKTII